MNAPTAESNDTLTTICTLILEAFELFMLETPDRLSPRLEAKTQELLQWVITHSNNQAASANAPGGKQQ